MRFGSVCSGIEAASVAWHPLGWEAAWLSEIEPFPCAVLKHHYPDVPNYGDMTLLPERILSGEVEAPDLFCGGTPCQAFSVAGLRNSLDDARGNLSLTFVGIANAIDHVRSVRRDAPAIIFWENVPGVLNTKDNAFGCFLGALAGENDPLIPSGDKWSNAGCVYGPQRTVAWRVLDAQYFGVAQRRRRVFVIASARDDFDPSEILFEFEGVRRDTAPSRKEGQRPTTSTQDSPRVSSTGLQGGGDCGVDLSGPLSARDYKDAGTDGMNKNSAKMIPVMQEFVGALDTQCGGNKMSHQTIASGHLLPVKSFYESSLAQYREANVSGTIKRSGGVAGGGSETFLAQPIAFDLVQITSSTNRSRAEPGLPAGTISKSSNMHIAQPVAYSFDSLSSNSMKSENPNSGCNEVDVSRSLDTSRGLDPSCNQGGIGIAQPVAVYENHPADSRIKDMGEVCSTVTSRWGTGGGNMPIVSQPIAFEPGKMKRLGYGVDGSGIAPVLRAEAGDNQLAVAYNIAPGKGELKDDIHVTDAHVSKTIDAFGSNPAMHQGGAAIVQTKAHSHAVAQPVGTDCFNGNITGDIACTMGTMGSSVNASGPTVMQAMAVRRLTPVECERLQGFPDGYTNIPWRKASEAPDGPRYKALGNSWAVPVVRWIGKRIQERITT